MSSAVVTPAINHTMLRIADPKRSLEFYKQHFGMQLVEQLDVNELGFTNYYLAFTGSGALHGDAKWYAREGVLELTHNHDATPETFTANHGNVEPHRGFGHICFSVSDLEGTCEKLEADGVRFQKKLTEGRMRHIAFALDPDGYWIELIANSGTGIRFNHSMIRVRDKEKSLEFYRDKLGMKVINVKDNPDAKFTLYFLSFDRDADKVKEQSDREGIIELTYNYGTELQPDFSYHNGNDQPQGFGHFGLTVADVDQALAQFADKGVQIKKKRTEGKMKFIGFILDPDGYWIEVLPAEPFPATIVS